MASRHSLDDWRCPTNLLSCCATYTPDPPPQDLPTTVPLALGGLQWGITGMGWGGHCLHLMGTSLGWTPLVSLAASILLMTRLPLPQTLGPPTKPHPLIWSPHMLSASWGLAGRVPRAFNPNLGSFLLIHLLFTNLEKIFPERKEEGLGRTFGGNEFPALSCGGQPGVSHNPFASPQKPLGLP